MMKTSFQRKTLIRLSALAALASTAAMAHATTITFDGLQFVANGSAVNSYSEGGYSIAAPTGSLTVQQFIGALPSGVPSINVLRNASFALTGGTFTFDGFDGAFYGTDSTFRPLNITGFLAGVQTFSATIGSPTTGSGQTFASFNPGSGSSVFDRVVFTTGNQTGSLSIDNIRVTAAAVASVPEPATYALMGLGLLAIGCAQRRRMAQR